MYRKGGYFHFVVAILVLAIILNISLGADREDGGLKTITLHVSHACNELPVGCATVFYLDKDSGDRRVLGQTDDMGDVEVRIENDVDVIFIETRIHHTVALFMFDGIEKVGVIEISMPVWSIR